MIQAIGGYQMVRRISCRVIRSVPLGVGARGKDNVKGSPDMRKVVKPVSNRSGEMLGDLLLYAVRSGAARVGVEHIGAGGILDYRA